MTAKTITDFTFILVKAIPIIIMIAYIEVTGIRPTARVHEMYRGLSDIWGPSHLRVQETQRQLSDI